METKDKLVKASSLKIVYDDLKNKLDAQNPEEKLQELERTDSAQNTRLDSLKSTVDSHSTRIGQIETKNTNQDTRIAAAQQQITSSKSQIEYLSSENLTQNTRIATVETAASNLKSELESTDRLLLAAQKQLEELEQSHEDLQALVAVQDAGSRLQALESVTSGYSSRLDAVENANTSQESRLSTVETKNTNQDNRLLTIESKNVTQDTRLSSVESRSTSNATKITNLETANSKLTSRVAELENRPSGDGKVKDVQVNSTSVLSEDGVANVPIAAAGKYGVVTLNAGNGITLQSDGLATNLASDTQIDAKTNTLRPLVPKSIDRAIRAGLISNTQITDTDKPAILETIGAASAQKLNDFVVVQNEQPTVDTNKIWITEETSEIEIPTMADIEGIANRVTGLDSMVLVQNAQPSEASNKVWLKEQGNKVVVPTFEEFSAVKDRVDIAITGIKVAGTALTPVNGVVDVPAAEVGSIEYGTVRLNSEQGFTRSSNGDLRIQRATNSNILEKSHQTRPIVPANLDYAVRVGLISNSQITEDDKADICQTIGAIPNKPVTLIQTVRLTEPTQKISIRELNLSEMSIVVDFPATTAQSTIDGWLIDAENKRRTRFVYMYMGLNQSKHALAAIALNIGGRFLMFNSSTSGVGSTGEWGTLATGSLGNMLHQVAHPINGFDLDSCTSGVLWPTDTTIYIYGR